MTLPKLAATRPVTSFMVLMTTVVLGSISATRLPQEFFPKLAIPFVAVVVPYPNSNPTKIEKTIARPLEEVLATLPDVKRLRSNSDADTCERWGCRFGRQGGDRSGTRSGGGIIWSMRVKTSVTIDERVLKAIDKATTRTRSRSRVIEDAAREFLARRARAARESRDLEILDSSADALNLEMEDVLAYQADV